jgi:hypothetical protein
VIELFQRIERRDAAEVLSSKLPKPLVFESHRNFVREVLRNEVGLTAIGPNFAPMQQERTDSASAMYRGQLNSEGSPSDRVAAGYQWSPGTELSRHAPSRGDGASRAAPLH